MDVNNKPVTYKILFTSYTSYKISARHELFVTCLTRLALVVLVSRFWS